jgi:DNA-binding MarR family transcriptional regulator
MKPLTPGDRLNSVVVHVNRALRQGSTIGADLVMEHRSALSVVAFAGPLRMNALATIEQLSAPAISRTVDILERGGYVRRLPDPDDARAKLIGATALGKRTVFQGRDERARRIDTALRRLSPVTLRRIEDALDGLEQLVALLAPADARAKARPAIGRRPARQPPRS